jgi:hypothetical protein
MTGRPLPALLALIAAVVLASSSVAAPPPIAQVETDYLLQLVEQSGCEFYRNGSAYDARRAAAHLRDKYAALNASGKITTAEDFIEKVATKSSLTGRPYEVVCAGHARVTSAQWLRDALVRFRMGGPSRATHDGPLNRTSQIEPYAQSSSFTTRSL